MNDTTVLVTGTSGYIGKHCVHQLLEAGYRVRGTLRSLDKAPHLHDLFNRLTDVNDRLEFVSADLLNDAGWEEAVAGCTYVLHVASPFPITDPKDENELIIPAHEGTLRVLEAAANAGVERTVLTSSIVAIMYNGQPLNGQTLTAESWSDPSSSNITAYAKSKTIAERAAWEFVAGLGGSRPMQLSVINPGFVIGPLLDTTYGTSGEFIRKMMLAQYPGVSNTGFLTVDVRDVAATHIAAMAAPAAANQRFLLGEGFHWIAEFANTLKAQFEAQSYRPNTFKYPDIIVRLVGMLDAQIKTQVDSLGVSFDGDTTPARTLLNWQPLPFKTSLFDMGQSMINNGVLTK